MFFHKRGRLLIWAPKKIAKKPEHVDRILDVVDDALAGRIEFGLARQRIRRIMK